MTVSVWTEEKIKILEENKHLPKKELAELLGVSKTTLWRYITDPEEIKPRLVESSEGTKRCRLCEKVLPLTEFYFIKTRRAYNTYCKECEKIRKKNYHSRIQKKERVKIVYTDKWTKDKEKILLKVHSLYDNRELSEMLGVTIDMIWRRKKQLGLPLNDKENIPEGYAHCPDCKEVLPLDHFYIARDEKKKHSTYCIACGKIRAKRKRDEIKESGTTAEEYIKLHIRDKFFCEPCNKEKGIDDYYVFKRKNGRIERQCIECDKRQKQRRKERKIEKLIGEKNNG